MGGWVNLILPSPLQGATLCVSTYHCTPPPHSALRQEIIFKKGLGASCSQVAAYCVDLRQLQHCEDSNNPAWTVSFPFCKGNLHQWRTFSLCTRKRRRLLSNNFIYTGFCLLSRQLWCTMHFLPKLSNHVCSSLHGAGSRISLGVWLIPWVAQFCWTPHNA